ncbi:MAG: tetratricopeptide repeat protein [Planctomycetota bacterium]|jgi:tetratricopeptide (TPR) repeat protein
MFNHTSDKIAKFSGVRETPLLFLIIVSFLIGTVESAVLANRDKRGLRTYSIEGVLRLSEDEIDIGTAALILSREWGTQRTTHVYRRKIDDMAEAILATLKKKHLPLDHRAIDIINHYLFDELGFTAVDTAENPNDLFLHVVLEKKSGYCLGLSILYLSIAERLGLPIYGVVVPGHFFVRYDDGQRRFNIETTSNGAVADDEHYIEEFNPPSGPRTLYMKNLTKKQSLGCFFNNLGNSYMEVGDTDKAFEVLLRAVQINPLLSEANMNLGNVYLTKKMPLQAVEQYEKALTIIGNDAKAMNNLASAYMQLGDYPKAESYYKTALALDPEYIDVYQNLANAMQMQGRYEDAISQLKAGVVLNPDNANSFLLLGQICRQTQHFSDAEKYLLKALALDPFLSAARVSLGYVYLDQGRLQWAESTFQKALFHDKALPQAHFGLAQIYFQKDQIDREIQSYETALAYDPYMVAGLQNLGNAYIRQGNESAALVAFQQAIGVDPQNTDLHYNLAVTYAKMQEHQQAVAAFSEAIKLDPTHAAAYNGIAISYYHLGQKKLAGTHARKAETLGYEVQRTLLELK